MNPKRPPKPAPNGRHRTPLTPADTEPVVAWILTCRFLHSILPTTIVDPNSNSCRQLKEFLPPAAKNVKHCQGRKREPKPSVLDTLRDLLGSASELQSRWRPSYMGPESVAQVFLPTTTPQLRQTLGLRTRTSASS